MCGSETLAMLVSSTSMNVASITVAAISHGLTAGVQGTVARADSARRLRPRGRLAPFLYAADRLEGMRAFRSMHFVQDRVDHNFVADLGVDHHMI